MTDIGAPGQVAAAPTRPTIADLDQLLAVIAGVAVAGMETWYRGHRSCRWTLTPSVFRDPLHRDNELPMLSRFRQEAAVAGIPLNLDAWGWVTFAQHHGLPSRLLDWSQSPLVGLYFACEEDPPGEDVEDGEFFILRPSDLNAEAGDDGGGHPVLLVETESSLSEYYPGRDEARRSKPRAVIAPLSFERIRAQTGTFTVSQKPRLGDNSQPLRQSKALDSYLIPPDSKRVMRQQLRSLGFDEVSIYKDLDRIAKRIRSNYGSAVQ